MARTAGKLEKRFWKKVTVDAVADECTLPQSCWQVMLDRRVIRSPGRRLPLVLPSRQLADMVAWEWDTQAAVLDRLAMPLTHLAFSLLDFHGDDLLQHTQRRCLEFLVTDTACFRAEEPRLADAQAAEFTPLLTWLGDQLAAPPPCVSHGLFPSHDDATIDAARSWINSLPAAKLALFDTMAHGCKSFTLAYALYHDRVSVEDAVRACMLEELHQQEKWGLVEGNHDLDQADLATNLGAAKFMQQHWTLPSQFM